MQLLVLQDFLHECIEREEQIYYDMYMNNIIDGVPPRQYYPPSAPNGWLEGSGYTSVDSNVVIDGTGGLNPLFLPEGHVALSSTQVEVSWVDQASLDQPESITTDR